MDKLNFHDSIDEVPNIMVLVKIKGMRNVIAVYSESPISKKADMPPKAAFFSIIDE